MAQIAISLPKDTLELVERECETTGETQSEFIIRLLDDFLKQQKEAEMVAQYKRGYELYPETEEEFAGLMAAQMEVISELYWDDDYAKMSRGEIPYDDGHPLADTSQTEE